ncbi:hypothetical protein MESS2_1340008 [Mesorhizobium metallidurans STM 2683]|uniref:Uncharacterized protein n=1 Tax=Mesorhizobium metallidurans STM 2683 TaxID=1297569 RepID=M5EK58_9HYPH|nr:hypothetical protein MESS2_1340008 [Mesorhizobium metallidurans STM 2683]
MGWRDVDVIVGWRWRSTAPPSVLPDISPSRGEIGGFGAGVLPATLESGEIGGAVRSPP